jgi:hypothetical protein
MLLVVPTITLKPKLHQLPLLGIAGYCLGVSIVGCCSINSDYITPGAFIVTRQHLAALWQGV